MLYDPMALGVKHRNCAHMEGGTLQHCLTVCLCVTQDGAKDRDHVHMEGSTPWLELLLGISGAFRPKVLTCLMGVTGAGKTTLMDVLAGRKTGMAQLGHPALCLSCNAHGDKSTWH